MIFIGNRLKKILVPETGVDIYDEGGLVKENATILDIIGENHIAKIDSNNPNKVNLYSPSVSYSSHFNLNDGNESDGTVNDITTYQRYIGQPTSEGNPFYVGDWYNVDSLRSCINSDTITYSPNGTISLINNSSTFTAKFIPEGGSEIIHTTTIDSNKDVTVNNIRIIISNFSTEFDQYKCNISIQYDLSNLLSNGGRFSIYMEHDNNGTLYTKEQNDIFYDLDNVLATIGTINVSVNVPQTKRLSGVYYMIKNTTFNVQVNDLNQINNMSRPNNILELEGSELGLDNLLIGVNPLIDWDNKYDDISADYSRNNWGLTQDLMVVSNSTNVKGRTIDWVNNSWINSNILNVCIHTYSDNRTRVLEDFLSEDYRLESNLSTLWDSSQFVNSYDDNKGLITESSRLVYPTKNYKLYEPYPSSQPDYRFLSGDKTWIGRFWHTNVSHSNGLFSFTDTNITETDIANDDFKLEISLNGTDWYNCNEDYTGGYLSDSSGCRINSDNYNLPDNLEFTFGLNNFTDSSSNWGIYWRISFSDTIRGKDLYLGRIEIINW